MLAPWRRFTSRRFADLFHLTIKNKSYLTVILPHLEPFLRVITDLRCDFLELGRAVCDDIILERVSVVSYFLWGGEGRADDV